MTARGRAAGRSPAETGPAAARETPGPGFRSAYRIDSEERSRPAASPKGRTGAEAHMRDAERRAVAAVFFLLGAISGTFASRLPWIADRLHLSSGRLGVALTAVAVGATCSVPFSGRLVQRFGAKAACCGLMWFAAAALPLVALMPDLPALCAATAALGIGAATTDMAMNSQGILVEKRLGRSIMSGLHGMWSAGVLVAAFLGSLAARLHVDARAHFAATAAVVAAAVLVATRYYRTAPEDVGI